MILELNAVCVPTNHVYLILIANTPSHSGGVSPPEHHIVSRGGSVRASQCLGVGQVEHHIVSRGGPAGASHTVSRGGSAGA